eukprot:6219522-Prymnesium_polylepis.1
MAGTPMRKKTAEVRRSSRTVAEMEKVITWTSDERAATPWFMTVSTSPVLRLRCQRSESACRCSKSASEMRCVIEYESRPHAADCS